MTNKKTGLAFVSVLARTGSGWLFDQSSKSLLVLLEPKLKTP